MYIYIHAQDQFCCGFAMKGKLAIYMCIYIYLFMYLLIYIHVYIHTYTRPVLLRVRHEG